MCIYIYIYIYIHIYTSLCLIKRGDKREDRVRFQLLPVCQRLNGKSCTWGYHIRLQTVHTVAKFLSYH